MGQVSQDYRNKQLRYFTLGLYPHPPLQRRKKGAIFDKQVLAYIVISMMREFMLSQDCPRNIIFLEKMR